MLGRFLSADTIVPQPDKPQGLNRYAYTYNNPVKYTDPTGHYSPQAIGDYCKEHSDSCNIDDWKADKDWWDMLIAAESSDMLVRVNGSAVNYYQFVGYKRDRLLGIMETTGPGKDSQWTANFGPLGDIFTNRGQGLGALHFDSNGDVSVIGKVGNLNWSVHKTTEEDVDNRNTALGVAAWGIGAPAHWVVGLVLAAAQGRLNRQMSTLPGMTVGDNELTVAGFTQSGPPEEAYGHTLTPGTYWGWKYIFRRGMEQTLSTGYYSQQVYNPHRYN